jgi:energy-coupling factor transporter ATP-binding protein EcfA2
MHITSMLVRNFRGIRFAKLSNLGSMIVIAGTNGSGKSTIFDAIRLLKSVYGSASANEPDQWFGEFKMPLDNTPDAFVPLFNDKDEPLEIEATFAVHPSERAFLSANSDDLIRSIVARDITGGDGKWSARYRASLSRQVRQSNEEINKFVAAYVKDLRSELRNKSFVARFSIKPGDIPDIPNSRVLETIFSSSEPQHLGGLRYHSAQRNYAREQLHNVAINVVEQRRDDPSSYLYGNAQYTNIKQEMATAYVRELVAADAGVVLEGRSSISDTLKELFRRFFPGKEFLGPRPNKDGNVFFPVKIGESGQHDLDDLSSGEKEIVYGYLRMRNSSPRYSIVLIDEPELHLNPVLIGGLPDFYHRHLGAGLENQLWLVTHSDTLLRESLGRKDYSIHHMVPQTASGAGENQAIPLRIDQDAQRAIFDLVGDWAAYRPGAKLVIFEGGGKTDFDVRMTGLLFPKEREAMNFLSAGSRSQARAMHAAIETSDAASDIHRKVFSIADKDSEPDAQVDGRRRFAWDRYHIENYLLEPERIAAVIKKATGKIISPEEVCDELKMAAQDSIGPLIRHELLKYARKAFGDLLDVSVSPDLTRFSPSISKRIRNAQKKLGKVVGGPLSSDELKQVESAARKRYAEDLKSDVWLISFRGRDILKRFSAKHAGGTPYDVFVNLIIDEMRTAGDRPMGMARVLQQISSS